MNIHIRLTILFILLFLLIPLICSYEECTYGNKKYGRGLYGCGEEDEQEEFGDTAEDILLYFKPECGDGICEEDENEINCPEDCLETIKEPEVTKLEIEKESYLFIVLIMGSSVLLLVGGGGMLIFMFKRKKKKEQEPYEAYKQIREGEEESIF